VEGEGDRVGSNALERESSISGVEGGKAKGGGLAGLVAG